MPLLSVKEFAQAEPIMGGAQNVRAKISRGVLDDVVVRIGGRIYINPDRWEALKRGELRGQPERAA
jgi:prefoldin subunit 5